MKALPKIHELTETTSEGVEEAACVDRISNLPVDIVHQILNCVPYDDAAKTSVLSRGWQNIWASYPDFFFVERADQEKRDALWGYMEKTLDRRNNSEYKSQVGTLVLRVTVENTSSEFLVKGWIDFALKNKVKRLCLDIPMPDNLHFHLLHTSFSSATLDELIMQNCKFKNCSFVLPNLTVLYLGRVCIEDDDFKDLISGSPLLQELKISSFKLLSTIVVSNPALKSLHIVSFNGKILVQSPAIESVKLELPSEGICEVEITSTATVKNLTLCDVSWEERALMDLVNKCPLLENLVIHGPYLPTDMSLSHQHLKSIVLQIFDLNYRIIRMDAPKLKCLEYFGGTPPLFGMKVSQELDSVKVHLMESDNFDAQWYSRLRKLLESFAHSKHLTLICENEQAIIFPDELSQTLLPTINDLKNLELQIDSSTATSKQVLDGFIWMLPGLKTLTLTLDSISQLIEFPQRG